MVPTSVGEPGPGRLRSRSRPDAPCTVSAAGLHRLDDGLVLVPEQPAQGAPLLVFFHGAGGSAAAGLQLVEQVVEQHGLLAVLPSSVGSTWDLLTGGVGPDVEALDALLEQVLAGHSPDRVALGGFSDGGSYALSLGLANGDLADAVLALSPGFAAPPQLVGRPRVWVQHGAADAVLPVARCGRRVAASLRETGYAVRYEEFAGGHVVPPELVDAGVRWWLSG